MLAPWRQRRRIFFVHGSLQSNHPRFERHISKTRRYTNVVCCEAKILHLELFSGSSAVSWRYTCGSSGSRAPPPPHLGTPPTAKSPPPPPHPQSTPPPEIAPPAQRSVERQPGGGGCRIRTGCSRPVGAKVWWGGEPTIRHNKTNKHRTWFFCAFSNQGMKRALIISL